MGEHRRTPDPGSAKSGAGGWRLGIRMFGLLLSVVCCALPGSSSADDAPLRRMTKEELDRKLTERVHELQAEGTKYTGFGAGRADELGKVGLKGKTPPPPQFFRYSYEVQRRVKEHWHWTKAADEKACEIAIHISEKGEITGITLVQSSGDKKFDEAAVQAARAANPLPPPPEGVRDMFREVRIHLRSP